MPNPYIPSKPSTHYRQPTIRESLIRGGVNINSGGGGDLGRYGHNGFDFGHNGDHHNAHRHVPIMGGRIVSPRHSDRAMHARTLGASRFDVIELASVDYHHGMDGVEVLIEGFIQDCGYG